MKSATHSRPEPDAVKFMFATSGAYIAAGSPAGADVRALSSLRLLASDGTETAEVRNVSTRPSDDRTEPPRISWSLSGCRGRHQHAEDEHRPDLPARAI